MASRARLLEVQDLVIELQTPGGRRRVVDEVSFEIEEGETFGLLGESGSGKTLTALSLMRLLPDPPARIAGGRVLLRGEDLVAAGEPRLRALRGGVISLVFQEPQSALNPVLRIGEQLTEALRLGTKLSRAEARASAVELLREVRIASPLERMRAYPHQLSAGMRQRVLLAIALARRPALLVADEPTTALDAAVQAQILSLIRGLQASSGMGILLITHDLALAAQLCQRAAFLLEGQLVEAGPVADLYSDPAHPYTAALIQTARAMDGERDAGAALTELALPAGRVTAEPPQRGGCSFAGRCPHAGQTCHQSAPPLVRLPGGRAARCFAAGERRATFPAVAATGGRPASEKERSHREAGR